MNDPKIFTRAFLLLFVALLAWSLSFERPEFRAWEVVKDPHSEYFHPNQSVEMTEVGDLGFRYWIKSLQVPREGRFTTDEYGFRNPAGIEGPRVVILGDSFVAGASLRDEEILSAQLGALLGEPVYNIAVEIGNSPSLYVGEQRFLQHPPKVVVFAPINRLLGPFDLIKIDRTPHYPDLGVGEELRKLNHTVSRDNGFSRAMRFGFNELKYRLFGHPAVVFPEGAPALAIPLAEQRCFEKPEDRYLTETIESAARFSQLLARLGVTFVYMPIPDSAEIYPEIFPPEELARCARPSMFDVVIPEARKAGLVTIDLRTVFRTNKSPYLYARDDSHWNARAVGIAAEELAKELQILLPKTP